MERFRYDRSSKWLIDHHGNLILFLGQVRDIADVTTLLGAHAIPAEYAGRGDDYVRLVCDEMIPRASAERLGNCESTSP